MPPDHPCTKNTLRPAPTGSVRWLDRDADYPLAADYWRRIGSSLSRKDWDEAHTEYRYRFAARSAAVIVDGTIIATAALLPFSDWACEVAAVSTDPLWRCRGYGKAVVSFVTAEILSAGRIATCVTQDENQPMIKTAHSVGSRVASESEAVAIREGRHAYFGQVNERIRTNERS